MSVFKMMIVLFLSVVTARPLFIYFPNTTITPLLPPLVNTTTTPFNTTNTTTTNPYNIYTVPNTLPTTTTITTRVTATTTLTADTGTLASAIAVESEPAQSEWKIDAKTLVILVMSSVAFILLLFFIYWCIFRKRGNSDVAGQNKKRRVDCLAPVRMGNLNQV
ncbi:hypothetical protein QBC37DRAFT_375708 [Rhypophila decipiens]|uniref:Uncharacterized protein n=1 Tax=Rhypophila decipiens TaxID=261697 RepID=A0AAN6Y4P3_9PEZI|nr:hypothetical protein QBC37DRAFT_375708 [Rhypophila decipiens]